MNSPFGPAIRKLAIAVRRVALPHTVGAIGMRIKVIALPPTAKPKDVNKIAAAVSVSVTERLRNRRHRRQLTLRHPRQLTLARRARASAQRPPTPIFRASRVRDLVVMCFLA